MTEHMITVNKDGRICNCNFYGEERKIVLRKRGHIKNCTIEPDVIIVDNRAWYIKLWRRLFDRQALY